MIKEVIKITLGLSPSSTQMGESFIHNCEVMIWPVEHNQTVYVMDCDYEGRPLRNGNLKVLTFWKIGLKIAKEVDCTEEFLLSGEGRDHILKTILL